MTKSKLHKALLAVTLAGGLCVGAGTAYATPGTIFVGQDSIRFDPASATPGVGPGGFVSITSTELEWVDTGSATANTSFLRILGPANTDVNIVSDTGLWTDIGQIQHENNIIPVSSFSFLINTLTSFQLDGATFALFGGDTIPEGAIPTQFSETSNSGSCAPPNPVGSICDDIFTLNGIQGALGAFAFTALGEEWEIVFRLLAEVDEGTFFDGFETVYTGENRISNIFLQAQINQLDVPEPGSLALLGLGLLGLGLPFARRQSASKV